MTQRLEAQGKKNSGSRFEWDDGSDYDDVTKIFVRGCSLGIQYIQFNYIKNGQPKCGSVHGLTEQGFTQTFEINHLKEKNGTKFSLSVDGKKIIGFHGSPKTNLNSLGAYFTWIAPTRLEAQGGKGGEEWNDGSDHEGVTKIYVRGGCDIIQYVKFDYLKDGQQIFGSAHGAPGRDGYTQTFEINHLNKEYLVSVEGYYDDDKPGVIHGLEFEANIKTSGLIGYAKGNKFRLAVNGKKIIGFHGYSTEKNLNSLGAYFTTSPLTKLEYIGETIEAVLWDDGAYDGVKKVTVYCDVTFVWHVRFDYVNGGKVERLEHGSKFGSTNDFVVDYPNEFITSVEGTLTMDGSSTCVSSLTFKTSKGRTSLTFGREGKSKFVLESKGCALVGFHGRSRQHQTSHSRRNVTRLSVFMEK
ncbi:unnamed protein product [Microthlaspi erraticum]|uniref:Jacalin-type lectin domain-containing protein n=1 Tax=Microthlaspi erraticum TaxID=1685480 RepID=A0A6D2JTU8_9BRAS|nr:unnamed protein product [Microthlaspi erraticum]